MRGLLIGATLLLISTAAFAQDLTLTFVAGEPFHYPMTRLRAGGGVTYRAEIRSQGAFPQTTEVDIKVPGTVQWIYRPDNPTCTGTLPIRCSQLPTGSTLVIEVNTFAPAIPGGYVASATVTGSEPDPVPSDNSVTLNLTVSSLPDLRASTNFQFARGAPLETVEASAFMQNIAAIESAHDARLVVTPTGGATIKAITPIPNTSKVSCSIGDDTAVCTVPALAPSAVFSARVTLTAPDRDTGGKFGLSIDAMAAEEDFDRVDNIAAAEAILVRWFHVMNTNDSGAGSLRQAMLEANALCDSGPCLIEFKIPEPLPEGGRFTILPESPLPEVAGFIDIDGGSQVEINGRKLSAGDGLVIGSACELHILGMAIRDFPGTGIVSAGDATSLPCYPMGAFLAPPVLVSDSVIERNLRGVIATGSQGIVIRRSVIGANRRSAIFLQSSRSFAINANRISGNGASGIYIGEGSGDILDNEISSNTDFGVARALFAGGVAMHRNLVFGNGHTAIDVGLDLETPNVGDDSNFAIPNHPQLFSAHYDPVSGKTVIRGTLRSSPVPNIQTNLYVELYTSDALTATGHAQAQQYLGAIYPANNFEFAVDGNLTGQWIAATNTRSWYSPFSSGGGITTLSHGFFPASTSELSEAIQVTP